MNPKVLDAARIIGRYVEEYAEQYLDHGDLKNELLNLGFSNEEISEAFKWIELNTLGSEADQKSAGEPSSNPQPIRVLTPQEEEKISPDAWGYLVRLHDRGILDPTILEEILEKILSSEKEQFREKDVRRLAALTVFNHVQGEWKELLHNTNTLIH